jgi:hypothetical protein
MPKERGEMESTEQSAENARSPFIPLLLLASALVAMLGFQAYQLLDGRKNLQDLYSSQEEPYAEARRLRVQLDGIAGGTARLAEEGNANARRVVEELSKRGITVKPTAASGQAEEGSPEE